MFKKIPILILLFSLIFTASVFADVSYLIFVTQGTRPMHDIFKRDFDEKGDTDHLHYIVTEPYELYSLAPIPNTNNGYVLKFLNDTDPEYLASLLIAHKDILYVRQLKEYFEQEQ